MQQSLNIRRVIRWSVAHLTLLKEFMIWYVHNWMSPLVWKSDFITAEESSIKYLTTQLRWIIDAFTVIYHAYHSCLQVLVDYEMSNPGYWGLFSFFFFFTWSQVFWIAYPEWETFMSLLWFNSFESIPPSFRIKQSRPLVQTTAFCCGAHSWGLYSYSTKMICSSVGRSLSEVFCQSLQTMPWWGELSWVERTDH